MAPFPVEHEGLVLPVMTALTHEGKYPDQDIRIVDTDIAVYQRYYPLKAQATYVGLWPQGAKGAGAAALYHSEVTFLPAPYGGRLPFREAMNTTTAARPLIKHTEAADIRGAEPQHNPARLKGTRETSLNPGDVGFNSVAGTRFWSPALIGEVTVEIEQDQLFKITDRSIFTTSPGIISLEVPGDDEQTIPGEGFHTLPEGAELVLDGKTGELKTTTGGRKESPNPPYSLNPVLTDQSKFVAEQAPDQLEWEDATDLLIMRYRSRFSKRLELTTAAAYAALHEQATQKLAQARDGLGYESIAMTAVLGQLQALRDEGLPGDDHLVTPRYVVLAF